jgi:hypothetical protein
MQKSSSIFIFTKDLNRMVINKIDNHSNIDDDEFIINQMFFNTSSKMIERDLSTNKIGRAHV